jgi:hypothetical protein
MAGWKQLVGCVESAARSLAMQGGEAGFAFSNCGCVRCQGHARLVVAQLVCQGYCPRPSHAGFGSEMRLPCATAGVVGCEGHGRLVTAQRVCRVSSPRPSHAGCGRLFACVQGCLV